jgi:hypothetical protein
MPEKNEDALVDGISGRKRDSSNLDAVVAESMDSALPRDATFANRSVSLGGLKSVLLAVHGVL